MNKKITALLCMTTLFTFTACSFNETKNEATVDDSEIVPHIEVAQEEVLANKVALRGKKQGVKYMPMDTGGVMPEAVMSAIPIQSGQWNRESYNALDENGFINANYDPLSTFSIDVDTASYANVRRIINSGAMPPVGAVRIEEMINYFSYDYPQPTGNDPIAISIENGPSPFNKGYELVKIGLKAKDIKTENLPPSNLVFLIDVSGSMDTPVKLGLLKKSMKMLVAQLDKQDRISIVVYAGSDRIVLQPTPGSEQKKIIQAIESLRSGGSTHASSGIETAYKLAHQAYMPEGNNRVILASDGDFNVGITSRGELQKLIEDKRKSGIYLTTLGFGMGNYHDDTMEILADKGNGNYAYIDSLLEAKKVLIKEMGGTLHTLAKDVKIQVEFNPAQVGAYRLIGYENRTLADEDFVNDKKDAGEIGAGHTVTALYEIIPANHQDIPQIDELKYQKSKQNSVASDEMLTVKLRYKPLKSDKSKEISKSLVPKKTSLEKTSDDFRFSAAVAGFGMLLKKSEYIEDFSWEECISLMQNSRGADREGYRAEALRLAEMGQLLTGER